jgi:predicted acyltransferase
MSYGSGVLGAQPAEADTIVLPTDPTRRRVIGIDAARGVAIAVMLLVERLPLPSPADPTLHPQLVHAEWVGLHVADVVFPAFLLLVGVSLAFALSRPARVAERARALARRTVALVAIGLVFNAWSSTDPTDLAHLRLPGVLQRIAVAGLLGAVVVLAARGRVVAVAAVTLVVLVGFGFALDHVHPSCPTPSPLAERACTWPGETDVHVLGAGHTYLLGRAGPDPEGVVSTAGATATVLIGWLVGEALRRERSWRVLSGLGAASVAAAGVAAVWGMPVIKRLWTPTFVLTTAAVTIVALGLLVALADVDDGRSPALRRAGRAVLWPAETLGRNALVVYVGQHLLGTAMDRTTTSTGETLTERLVRDHAGGSNLTFALSWVVFAFAVAAVMRALRWYVTV